MTAAVLVIELALGHRVVDVDCREQQRTVALHVVQTQHARGGLLGHTLDASGDLGEAIGVVRQRLAQRVKDDAVLLGVAFISRGDNAGLLELRALVNQKRRVAAVVEDHVRAFAVRPIEHLLGAPPVLLQRLALPGVDRDALGICRGSVRTDNNRSGGVVLGGEDVAGSPANLGAQRSEGLDENRGLNGHVERAGDAGALQGLGLAVLGAHRHQAGHLVLGQTDLVAAELSEGQIGNLVVGGAVGLG